MLTLREFTTGDADAFYHLNAAWIKRYFTMEPKDDFSLRHPQAAILEPGGRIFLACIESTGEPVGCCALMAIGPQEFEVAKMAVDDAHQGLGIGRRLLTYVIREADRIGATRLYLETNAKLTPAIHLYESLGFRHLPPEEITPSPYARANVYMERRPPR